MISVNKTLHESWKGLCAGVFDIDPDGAGTTGAVKNIKRNW